MERNMEFLIECMDDLSVEQQKVILGFHECMDEKYVNCILEYIFTKVFSISAAIPLS
jgi:hypothetical protein